MNGWESYFANTLDYSESALTRAIDAGVCAALLAMVVLVINLLFRRWLSSRQMGLLWGLVLLRLVIPVAPSSALSLQNLPNLWPAAQVETPDADDERHESGPNPGGNADSRFIAATNALTEVPAASTSETASPPINHWKALEEFVTMLPLVWLCGAATLLIWTTTVHWRFCHRVRSVPASEDARLLSLWNECCQRVRIRRRMPIVRFDGVGQPAILGLFRPKLLLPTTATELSDDQLRMVMLHELAHVQRWHIAANWVLVVIRAIHWWNPVYWLAAERFQSLREQSCDAFALRRIEGHPTRSYSELLLLLAQRPQSGTPWRVMLPASILGFLSSFFRKRAVKNRLKALRSAGVRRSRWHTVAAAALIGLVGISGLTDASVPESPAQPSSAWVSRGAREADWNAEPMVTQTYNVTKALDGIVALEPKVNAPINLYWCVDLILKQSTGRFLDLASDRQWTKDRLTLDGATLTVKAPLKVHAEIARNLSAWERGGLAQIILEPRLITDDRDITSSIGASWTFQESNTADREEDLPSETKSHTPLVRAKTSVDDYLPVAVALLDDRQVRKLLKAVRREKSTTVSENIKATTFNGEPASLFCGTQKPFALGSQGDREGVRQPKIALLDDGIKLTWRAVLNRDSRKVQLEGRVETSEVGDIRTASTLLRGEPSTLQIPRVKRRRIDVSSEVPAGHSLLIACIPTSEQKRFVYVLLTVCGIYPPIETK